MPAEDFSNGVAGSGQTWKEEVDTEQSENNYEGGATSEAAEEYQSNASSAASEMESGLAEYFGVDESDVTVGSAYSDGVSEAGRAWQSGVSESGGKWRRGVQRTDADEWEESTSAAAQKWFDNAREGVQGN